MRGFVATRTPSPKCDPSCNSYRPPGKGRSHASAVPPMMRSRAPTGISSASSNRCTRRSRRGSIAPGQGRKRSLPNCSRSAESVATARSIICGAIDGRCPERQVEAELARIGGNAVDAVDEAHRDRLVGPGPAQVGQRHAQAGMVAHGLVEGRPAEAARAAVDEDAAWKRIGARCVRRDRVHAMGAFVIRVPARSAPS